MKVFIKSIPISEKDGDTHYSETFKANDVDELELLLVSIEKHKKELAHMGFKIKTFEIFNWIDNGKEFVLYNHIDEFVKFVNKFSEITSIIMDNTHICAAIIDNQINLPTSLKKLHLNFEAKTDKNIVLDKCFSILPSLTEFYINPHYIRRNKKVHVVLDYDAFIGYWENRQMHSAKFMFKNPILDEPKKWGFTLNTAKQGVHSHLQTTTALIPFQASFFNDGKLLTISC